MKKFITKSLLFFLGLFILALIPDIILTHKVKNSIFNDYPIWGKIKSGQMDNDLLILGSSRAWVQYSPRIIDSILNTNSYNLGRDGKKLDISILCADLYLKHNPKPKVILCDIYFMSMCNSDPYGREQFFPYLFDRDIWKAVHKNHQIRYVDRFIPMLKYYGHLKEYLSRISLNDTTYKGYFGYIREWKCVSDEIPLKEIKEIPYYHDSTVLAMTDEWLQRCQKDSVKIVFVHSPMYYEATNKIDDTAAMWAMYRNLANKYNITILDYSHDSICYDTTLFYNAQHLNRKGAERFSLKLAMDLDTMGIIEKPF